MRFLGCLVALFSVSCVACIGPMMDVRHVDARTARELESRIRVYEAAELSGVKYTSISDLEGNSCKNLAWDPPASQEDAVTQLKSKADGLGANGLSNLACSSSVMGATSLVANCWSSVTCKATAIKVGSAQASH
jgi:uncharacterized protein YbjQ (UPF0145 family)